MNLTVQTSNKQRSLNTQHMNSRKAARRNRYAFDEEKVQRFIAEGRGAGMGPSYRPWLQIQDVPSSGRSHRPFGVKTQRVHHLLSDGEWKSFLRLEADASVVDIREQFPLDRIQTFQHAKRLGIRHPRTLDGTPYVLTLDFLVSRASPTGVCLVPYTFKYDFDDITRRERELLSLAETFCKSQGMELQFIDQDFFDEAFNINYDSVRAYHDISNLTLRHELEFDRLATKICELVSQRVRSSLLEACRALAEPFATTPQIVYQVALHLVARGVIHVNLSSACGLEKLPLSAYSLRN